MVIRNGESAWGHVTSGVPQGSVLGPTLFLIFVNELSSLVESRIKMFADDCKLYRPIGDYRRSVAPTGLQDLYELEKWTDQWLVKFTSSKCNVMHIGTKKKYAYRLPDEGRQWSAQQSKGDHG